MPAHDVGTRFIPISSLGTCVLYSLAFDAGKYACKLEHNTAPTQEHTRPCAMEHLAAAQRSLSDIRWLPRHQWIFLVEFACPWFCVRSRHSACMFQKNSIVRHMNSAPEFHVRSMLSPVQVLFLTPQRCCDFRTWSSCLQSCFLCFLSRD